MDEERNPSLQSLDVLVGEWNLEATHPMVPGVVVHGKTTFEWMDGEKFLLMRSENDHPDFPNSTSVIGNTSIDRIGEPQELNEALRMFYFDSRGVHRVYELSITSSEWKWWRDSEGFSQRFTGTFKGGGDTITGQGELCRDGHTWEDDIAMTYRRVP
ncbi:MAG: hypothetical protein ABR579_04095 [Actinomycetota bacterium]